MNNLQAEDFLKAKKEKQNNLKKIINIVYELDLMESTRARRHVDARSIFSKVMFDEGYGYTDIGRILNKNHASIIHAVRSANWLIENVKDFQKNYLEIIQAYNSDINILDMKNEIELKNSIISLNSQINLLHLENMRLKKENELIKNNESKFGILHNLVNERTKEKDIPVVHRKLNTIYNGL
jgi:hypothetical protein